MNFQEYLNYFEQVVANPQDYPVYQDETFHKYAELNLSRTNRWLKRFEVSQQTKDFISKINEPQKWIVITEPWCGDAAHSVPQLFKISELNENIELIIQLRDEEPFLIEQYLTNGGKSIPKLVIRNQNDQDIAVWGPRPEKLQELFYQYKEEGVAMDEIKETVQKWYNVDKGVEIQNDIINLLK